MRLSVGDLASALPLTLVLAVGSATAAAAQDPDSIVGHEARVWSVGASTPAEGVVLLANDHIIRLDTGEPYCGAGGCVRSLDLRWTAVERLQIGERDPLERAVLAASFVSAIAIMIGPLQRRFCDNIDSEQDIGRCTDGVFIGSGALGLIGLWLTRQRWQDVPVP